MVSDKMIEAGLFARHAANAAGFNAKKSTVAILKEALAAALTKFDPNNEATWPSNDTHGLLVKCSEPPYGYEVCWFEEGKFYHIGIPVREPVEYCLVADLLPSWIKEQDDD